MNRFSKLQFNDMHFHTFSFSYEYVKQLQYKRFVSSAETKVSFDFSHSQCRQFECSMMMVM